MIRALAWLRANEPLRLLLYPLLVAVVGWLVVRGTITADIGEIAAAVLALLLGVPATEAVRARVTPNGRIPAAAAAAARTALDEVERTVADRFGPSAANVVRQAREEIERAQQPDTGRHRA